MSDGLTRNYQVTLTGVTPLLMHKDDIDWADRMEQWKLKASQTKGMSKAGDDRTPAWRWLGCLYHDDDAVVVPADNISRCLMEAGAAFLVPGAKNKTFKEQTQSGMMPVEMGWQLLVDGEPIAMKPILELMKSEDFGVHREAVTKLGFSLFVKRAKVGASKHIRVRPRFDRWSASGTIAVWDPQITQQVLTDIVTFAGQRKGLGDWRPSSKTPGQFGRFSVKVEQAS